MKYTVKSKQNLDGVQTLTGDSLATYQMAGGENQAVRYTKWKSKKHF